MSRESLLTLPLLLLFLLSAFPFSQGWPQHIIILQTFLSSTSVSFAPTFPYLLLLHLQIFSLVSLFSSFPVTPFPSFLPTYSGSLLMTCPYHLSLPSLIFIHNRCTLTVLLMYSFLILFFLVTPIANLNIFISATSISSTCFFVTATVSSPYTIAGLTTELYTFPFTLAGNLLLQITPYTLFRILFSIFSIRPSCLYSLLYLPLITTTFLHR